MRASEPQPSKGLPILLLAVGGSLAALGAWSLARVSNDPPAAAVIVDHGSAAGGPVSIAADRPEEVAQRRESLQRPRVVPSDHASSNSERAFKSTSERGLREQYLALEKATPGFLATHAQEWLTAERPGPEKVAWLQALCASDPAAGLVQLEAACALRNPASPQGVSPAAFALESLVRASQREPAARAALGRLVADAHSIELSLRRRAAATLAANGDALELETLAQALLREDDECLRAGVVVALEARPDARAGVAGDRLLAWLRPGAEAFLARGQEETR